MTHSSNQGESGRPYWEDAYRAEDEKLSEVVRAIKEKTTSLESRMPAEAADQPTADAIQAVLLGSKATIQSALEQPYFGRIDYQEQEPGESAPMTIYIGSHHIPDTNVFSWTIPAARLWYTNESRYTAPRGEIRVRVDLKRYLRIRGQRLIELNDTYRRALPGVSASPATVPNQALTAALSGSGVTDGQLQVIVETIEPDQYESIANVDDQVLVVQGAAGSGKSEIGLHRIAYLLSPFNDIPVRERPTPGTTLFVGPSASFLEYVSDLLPRLGVQDNVRQVTFHDWLRSHHSVRLNIRGRIWNNLLDRGQVTKFNEQSEAFKGSTAMSDVLVRYVRGLVERVRKTVPVLQTLTVALDGGNAVDISGSEVVAALNVALSGAEENPRLNLRRRAFVERITNLAWSSISQRSPAHGEESELRRRVESEHVNPWLNAVWPRADFRQEYVELLSNSERMLRLSRGAINQENAEALRESVGRALTEGFEDSDAGALTFLDHLLNGTIPNRYRHIVVDEAQDISPIEFRLLRLNSVNNWFTILGDTAQRLTPYRGIRRWRDIERAVGRSAVKVQHARTSYRSNQHITRFNNRILRLFDTYIDAPIAFGRDGHRAEYHRHASIVDMYRVVVQEIGRIRSLEGLENANIGILARDKNNLNRFQEFFSEHGLPGVTLSGQEGLTQEGQAASTILARIPDTKGLEFDAVIVLGVNDSFASTTFNQKLLYLATTRAKHYLAIHWSGRRSPILQSIYHGGVSYFDHSRAGER